MTSALHVIRGYKGQTVTLTLPTAETVGTFCFLIGSTARSKRFVDDLTGLPRFVVFMSSPPKRVRKGVIFLGCPSAIFVRLSEQILLNDICCISQPTDGHATTRPLMMWYAISTVYWHWRWHGGTAGRALDLYDQQVVGSNLTRGKAALQPRASCSHLCASVTKQYNLVPAKGRWCSAAVKVTVGLAESNGSLPPGGWLIVTAGWLPVHRDHLQPNAW